MSGVGVEGVEGVEGLTAVTPWGVRVNGTREVREAGYDGELRSQHFPQGPDINQRIPCVKGKQQLTPSQWTGEQQLTPLKWTGGQQLKPSSRGLHSRTATPGCLLQGACLPGWSAAGRKGNNLKGFKDVGLKDTAILWP